MMDANIKPASLELMGDVGLREEEVSSDTENRNDNDVFQCGKCELRFQSSYHLHHHIAYTHAGISMETSERLTNPYPVEPLALNLKHSNRVDSPILNKSCEPSPLSKTYRRSSQSVALDLSKPSSNTSEVLDLSTTKFNFREGEVTGQRKHPREVKPSENPQINRSYDCTSFEKEFRNGLGKATADEMVKRGRFLVDNPAQGDDFVSCHDSKGGDENKLVIDCSSESNKFLREEKEYEPSLKESQASVTNSQDQLPQSHDRGLTCDNWQNQHHLSQGQQPDNHASFPSVQSQSHLPGQGQSLQPDNHSLVPSVQSQGHLQGQGLPAGSECGRFNALPFPFNIQKQVVMMNGGGASPPISNYGVMSADMQQSLMSFQQQMSPFMKGKPGPVKATKVNRRARVKAVDVQEDKNKSVVEIYECKVCNRKFSQVGNFHNHMKLHSTKICVCGICKIEFLDSYELQRHMRKTHTGDMPYKCEQCDREFSQYNNLRRHLRVHNGKSYKCHICGRTFNEVFYLEMHIGSHTGERTYSCGVCSLSFRDNAELQRHVQTHSAAELHTCEVCGKSFSKACVLRQHKKMHSGLRPFKCDICDKAFIHRHHLKIHSRMHSTDKPYQCKICGKDFAQTSHLYKHVRQHAQKTDEGDADVCTQAEIQALYPGLCQGSHGSPSPLTTSGVSDLSQSSGSPVNSPITEGDGPAVPSETIKSDGVDDTLSKPQLSENRYNNLDVKKVGKNKVDMKTADDGCDNGYRCDDGINLDHIAKRREVDLMDQHLKDLKGTEESTASDTMESDIDTESGELSPLENEPQHDYRPLDVTESMMSRGDNYLNQSDFSCKDKELSVQRHVENDLSTCDDFSKRIKEECSQMSQNMSDIKDEDEGVKVIKGVTGDTSGKLVLKKETQDSNIKQNYSIEHLLQHSTDHYSDNGKKSFINSSPTSHSSKQWITESRVENNPSQHPTEPSKSLHNTESSVKNQSSPSLTVLDNHLNANSERSSNCLHQNSLSKEGQGYLDQQSSRFNESASPISSDHLSTVSSQESELSRSRSSSLESEDKRSQSFKMMNMLKGQKSFREEDVTSSADKNPVSNSYEKAYQAGEDNSGHHNLHPSYEVSTATYHPETVFNPDRSSPHTKPKQKRRRRQNNKNIPPEQNYLPLIPNLGIDPQQMYLLQLHQMQMAMAASMAAGAQMYPFPGNRMMSTGSFDTSMAYSPEINHHRDFNRERSQSPQVARSHDIHRQGQEGLLHLPSNSPQNKEICHSGSPTMKNLAPTGSLTSSRDEMMRYMVMKQEMASNGHN